MLTILWYQISCIFFGIIDHHHKLFGFTTALNPLLPSSLKKIQTGNAFSKNKFFGQTT